ncbi:3TM-type holin [Thiomicrorhabdus lithotrophica]|uniref:Holin family protein n=1 Tax=Thiomicrorhabdus lithotrophica TaxID=2949997 RepID=A0ABY8C868_9GAMM|nr:3TM-type holin [Thiomicrorhabdus lithotrophica]WEJ62165.1 holin family protein [Thiomicrorhabdus lithotrophica]
MSFLSIVGSIIEPVTKLIDDLHTSDEEKLLIKERVMTLQAQAYTQALDYEKAQLQAQADIIKAEAQGQSWIQRSWRPITMLTFLVLVVCDSFGWLANPLAPEAWTLLQIGLGGYVVGRSAEKIAPAVMEKIGSK